MLYNAVAAIGQSIIATRIAASRSRQPSPVMPRSCSQRLDLKTGPPIVEFFTFPKLPSWLLAKLRSIRGFEKLNDPIS